MSGLIAMSDGSAIKVRRKASAWSPFSVPFRSRYYKKLMKSCSREIVTIKFLIAYNFETNSFA